MKTLRTFGWIVMAVFAALITWYALAIFLSPSGRSPIVTNLLANHPHAAPAHFIGGAVALLIGALQLNATLRARFISLHRWLGRAYVVAVAIAGSAGLILAPGSMGGFVAAAGFGLLAVVWLASTLTAFLHIKAKQVGAHREWMIRSYAVTMAAVTLRIYVPLSQAAGIPFDSAYPAIAWLCWVPNLLVAEWLIRAK